MRTDYGVLLMGASIPIENVGNCRSPLLKDVFKSSDDYMAFCFARAVAGGTVEQVRKMVVDMGLRDAFGMTDMDFDHCGKFDLVWTAPPVRSLFCGGLSLYFDGIPAMLPGNRCFVFLDKEETVTGVINKDNFSVVCGVMKTVSNPPQTDEDENPKFGSEAAKALWEKHNKLEAEHPMTNNEDYTLSNIISKMSCGTTNYTLLTIYELSVFQLYDQFDAYTQNRVSTIGEKAYSTWGGDDFDIMGWFHKNNQENKTEEKDQ